MSRRSAKWKRPTPTPQVRLPLPTKAATQQDHTEMVTLMKKVAEDVVLVMSGLEAQNNTGAF
jgi:hypothetical protein